MALTEVNSLGIKDLEVKTADIAAANVTLAKVADVTDGQIIVGNGSNRPTAVAVSGDVTLANTGAVTIANGAVEHAMLADDCVDGDNIAANSVDLAAMAGIARGKLIVGDSSGDPAYLNAGSNDHVLTMDANGDVGWEAAAGGGVDGITSNANATGLTIDSNERFNVGYGSNVAVYESTACKFQIAGDSADEATLNILSASDTATDSPKLFFSRAKGSVASPTSVANNSVLGEIVACAHDGTDYNNEAVKIEFDVQEGAGIASDDVGGHIRIYLTKDGDNDATDWFSFENSGTLRSREGDLDNYDNMSGQATASLAGWQLNGNGTASFQSSASNGNWTIFEITGGSGKTVFTGHGHAGNTGNSWGGTSDEKAKTDIVDAGSQWADLKALRVRNFKFKPEVYGEENKNKKMLGLVAQEAELVSPGLVTNPLKEDGSADPDGYKSLNYSVLYMKAVKALQEAMARIETLEAKVAALEAG